jgi:hypothetical protein
MSMDSFPPVALETVPEERRPGLARSRLVRAAVVLLPLLFGASKAMASLWVLHGVDQLTAQSDAVVMGRVEGVDASWEQGRITSLVHVEVSAAYKGHTRSEIELRVPGGAVGGMHMHVSSEPELRPGDEAVLFLWQHGPAAGQGQHYHVVDGIEGAVPIIRDVHGNALVTWTHPETGHTGTTPLSAFTDYVHAKALEQVK